MCANIRRANQVLMLFLSGLLVYGATVAPVRAEEGKDKKIDLVAEAKEAAEEDAKAVADREKGIRRQRIFNGTFVLSTDPSTQQGSPDVIGWFVTDEGDKMPGQTYLVKALNNNKDTVAALQRLDKKKATVTGKLQNEGKYLVVFTVVEASSTPPPQERRKGGGL